jgi:hypothetical protein
MKNKKFLVTKKAMRPVSEEKRCFYCHQPIGEYHLDDCVLIEQKATVKMIVEYEVNVPFSWDKEDVEFNRNEGTWCSDNAIEELKKLSKKEGCLCSVAKFKCLKLSKEPFLSL